MLSNHKVNPREVAEERACPCGQQYYRLAKVAELFDVSEKTLRRMITNRQLKATRIGGSIRIPHEELAKIVREY